jgi:hypothetical protein
MVIQHGATTGSSSPSPAVTPMSTPKGGDTTKNPLGASAALPGIVSADDESEGDAT